MNLNLHCKVDQYCRTSNRKTGVSFGRTLRWFWSCLMFIAITSVPLNAAFTGVYALDNFSLTNTNLNPSDLIPANGFADLTRQGSLVLTGSNTGSGLFPGATTDLTIAAPAAGEVRFDWLYSSLED